MVAITEGEAITINEGKRSAGKRGRGIGIGVCVGKNEYPLMKEVKTERPAKNAGRASRWIFREASARKPVRLDLGIKRDPPPEFGIPAGGWTGRISRIRIFASAPRACLNRQAGFTAARPAANWSRQRQTVLTVVLHDRTLLTGALNGELSGTARTLRLIHDRFAELIEAG